MVNTKDFYNFSNLEYKQNTASHWGKKPCGSRYTDDLETEKYSQGFFLKLDHDRYVDDAWLVSEIQSLDVRDKEVLEIGYGMGSDHLQLALKGGKMHGISLAPQDKVATDRHLELYGFRSDTIIGDAENMPYEDNVFDFVYSVGVLHHSPNIEKVCAEIYRVLRPGGECYLAVYNKSSMFFWWTVFLWGWLLSIQYKKYTLKQRVSLIEYPNDNPDLVVKLYTPKQFKQLVSESGLEVKSMKIDHLNRDSIQYSKLFSDNWIKQHAKRWGWYIIIRAKKE